MYTGDSGSITYPVDGGFYEPNLNCYFKIVVGEGKKVKVQFEHFDLATGYNYGISYATNEPNSISKKFRKGKKG